MKNSNKTVWIVGLIRWLSSMLGWIRVPRRTRRHAGARNRPKPQRLSQAGRATETAATGVPIIRVGQIHTVIYLDLANDAGQFVKITADGWTVVTKAPIEFTRPAGMLPLPCPVHGGTLEELRPFLAELDTDSWILLVAWLVGALNPAIPYPVLILIGEQGTAKSTMTRLLRRVIDPNANEVRMLPQTSRDLAIAVSHNHILAFDNVSRLLPAQSDALCQLATGGSFATRQLFTDRNEVLIPVQRPVILNGIDEFVERTDLRDRCIRIDLRPIPAAKRRCEVDLNTHLAEAHPRLLGALCDAVSTALSRQQHLDLPKLPRMADFARWVVAAEPGLPWPPGAFLKALATNNHQALEMGLLGDPLCGAITDLIPDGESCWQGTVMQLQQEIQRKVPSHARRTSTFPINTQTLVSRLRRIGPDMRSARGIDIVISASGQEVTVSRIARRPTDNERIQPGFTSGPRDWS